MHNTTSALPLEFSKIEDCSGKKFFTKQNNPLRRVALWSEGELNPKNLHDKANCNTGCARPVAP